jgi:hypothetical protein
MPAGGSTYGTSDHGDLHLKDPGGLDIMKKTTFVFAAAACLISSLPAAAQSPLAEAAKREAERRRAVRAETVPTYTTDDLNRLPSRASITVPARPATEVTTMGVVSSAAQPAPLTGAVAAPGAPGQPPAPGPRDEKYWRERMTTARTALSRAEIFAESLQSRINALSADFVNTDDPAKRQQVGEQRQQALNELNKVKQEIIDARKQIGEIEAEARRLNVPAGWLR